MTNKNEALHPILDAAFEYADARTELIQDRSTKDKAWSVAKDEALFRTGRGIYQIIKEMHQQPDAQAPYALDEAYAVLILINRSIGGLSGNLRHSLVSSGVAESAAETDYIIAQARYHLEKHRNLESTTQSVPMIGIVGPISSGKGTIGEKLQSMYGGMHLPLSDRLREVSLALGGDRTFPRQALREINDVLKPAYGNDVFVRWTMNIAQRQANRNNYPLVTLDGFRSLEEAQTFIKAGGTLIGVTASQETRFQRLVARERFGDDGWESFLESDAIESTWIDPILSTCQYLIDNESDESNLDLQVQTLVQQMSLRE